MSRYDGLIIPRSYSEYINKTDAATLSQALQLAGVLAQQVTAENNAAVTSNAVNSALADYYNKQSANQLFAQKDNEDVLTFKKTTNSSSTVMNIESSYNDGKCYLGFRNKTEHLGYFGYTAENKPMFYDSRNKKDLIIPSIEVITKNYGDITINSSNYVSVGAIIPSNDTRFVIGYRIKSWNTNTGAFSIFPYANNLCYAVGNAGVKITGLAVDWFVATI